MRKKIVSFLKALKEDFRISETSKTVHDNLITTLTHSDIFSDEWTKYFSAHENGDYPVLDSDPTPIATTKKILNSLDHVTKAFTELDSIPVDESRYTVGIYKDVVKKAYNALYELSSTFFQLNHATSGIQDLIGSYLQDILPTATEAFQRLQTFRPEQPGKSVPRAIGALFNVLPTKNQDTNAGHEKFSRIIHELPQFFHSMQTILFDTKAKEKDQNTQDKLEKQINDMKKLFDNVSEKNRFFALPSFTKIGFRLLKASGELVNSAAPLTQAVYERTLQSLNTIRHELIPNVIAGIESMETHLGLRPGLLTKPVTEQLEQYYRQLVENTDVFKQAATMTQETLPSYIDIGLVGFVRRLLSETRLEARPAIENLPDIAILQDVFFKEKLSEERTLKLKKYQTKQGDTSNIEAAKKFFDKLGSYSGVFQARCKWSLANLDAEDKQFLAEQYKQFQEAFASVHPEIDHMIVDALIHTNEGLFLSRITNSDYKQLLGSNHFKTILGQQTAFLSKLHQDHAQTQFVAQQTQNLIDKEPSALSTPDYPIVLRQNLKAFSFSSFPSHSTHGSENFKQKEDQLQRQHLRLEGAHQALQAFMEYFQTHSQDKDISIHKLSEKDKQHLRHYYQKFQSLVAYHDPELNTLFVKALGTDLDNKTSLHLSEIETRLEEFHENLEVDLNQTEAMLQDCMSAEREDNQKRLSEQPLAPLGEAVATHTLLDKITQLNLPEKVESFTHTFKTFLQDNLEPEVLEKLNLEDTSLPYENFYQESSTVQFYKNLLNAVEAVREACVRLEKLNQAPSNLINRTTFFYQLGRACYNLNNAKYNFEKAISYAGINTVIQEGLELLAPLKNIPLIGTHLSNVLSPQQTLAAPVNMIEAWQAQQDILTGETVASAPEGDPTAPSESDPMTKTMDNASDIENESSYLEQFANTLYRVPHELKKLNRSSGSDGSEEEIKAEIQAFIDSLSQLSYGPGTLKKILNATNVISEQLNSTGLEIRQFILNLRNTLGQLTSSLTDTAEFQLAFKPGQLSEPILNQIDLFYQRMLSHIAVHGEEEDTHLEYLLDNQLTYERQQKEKDHLNVLTEDASAQLLEAEIFGTEEEDGILANFQKIRSELSEQKNYDMHPSNLSEAIENTFLTFLENYQAMLPHLNRIDPEFNADRFLREIQTKNDWLNAIDKILGLEEALHAVVDAEKDEKQTRIERCENRISYLENKINEEQALKEGQRTSYQESIFETIMETKLNEMIHNKVKNFPVLPNALTVKIQSALEDEKSNILTSINSSQTSHSVIKNLIETKLDQALSDASEILTECTSIHDLMRQIQNEGFGEKDVPIKTYLHTQQRQFKQAQSLEILQDTRHNLEEMLDYLQNNPTIQAVKHSIQSLKTTAGVFTKNKLGKAKGIEDRMAEVPLDERGIIQKQTTEASKKVVEAISMRRKKGKLDAPRKNATGEIIEKGRIYERFKSETQTQNPSGSSTTLIKEQLKKMKQNKENDVGITESTPNGPTQTR